MGNIVVTNTTAVAIEKEVTEGTYVAPAGASSFVQTLASGLEMKPAKELLDREVFAGTIGKVTPRTGTKSVSGTIPVEFRAHSTEGHAPEFDKLMESALGTKRQSASTITTKTGNTGSVLKIEDADISSLNVGDIVLVKEAGAFHVSPIQSKVSTPGSATVTLLRAKSSGTFSDNVQIAKLTTYTVAESGHPTLSITKYVSSAIRDKAIGCRVTKVDISDMATGKLPKISFGFDGLSFDKAVAAPSYTPSYDGAYPPIMLDAHAYMDGTEITLNEISLSIENTVSKATAFNTSNGNISSRITKRAVKGSMDPYQEDDSVANFTKFVNNTEFSLFAYAKNDTGVTGEFNNVIAIYLPKCLIVEAAETDADGLVRQSLSFEATRGSDAASNEVYISFI